MGKLPAAIGVVAAGAAAFLAQDRAGLAVIDHFELHAVADRLDLDLGRAGFDLGSGKALRLQGGDQLIGGDGGGSGTGRKHQRRGQQGFLDCHVSS